MEGPLVSIIVPVYKAEQWLHRCVDSILAQTMEDFELLLIDDGSPDRSGEICDEYAAKDSRVRVFHKENGGVSSARQMGIDNANGEYIIHCDPDDWIELDMLMELTQYAMDTQSDMVICDYYTEDIDGGKCNYVAQNVGEIVTPHDVLVKLVNLQIHGSCCNKLVKRSCCDGLSFFPEDIVYAEDELFNIRLLNGNIKKVAYLPKAFYHYVQHKESLTASKNRKIQQSRIREVEEIEKILDGNQYDDFFVIKRQILLNLYMTKNLGANKPFKEIHLRIINAHKKYNPLLPRQYFFARALKGNAVIAYNLYCINVFIVEKLRIFKRIFSRQ